MNENVQYKNLNCVQLQTMGGFANENSIDVPRRKRVKINPVVALAPKHRCHACLNGGNLDKVVGKLKFHSACYAPCCRNRWRTMCTHSPNEAAGKALVDADKSKMVEEPDMWRIDIAGHLPDADKAAKRAAQAELRTGTKSFEVAERVDAQERRSGKIAIRKRHFKRHWRKWEKSDADTDECNEQFDKIHDEQGSDEDGSDGEEMITVTNPEKHIDDVTTKQTRHGVDTPWIRIMHHVLIQ